MTRIVSTDSSSWMSTVPRSGQRSRTDSTVSLAMSAYSATFAPTNSGAGEQPLALLLLWPARGPAEALAVGEYLVDEFGVEDDRHGLADGLVQAHQRVLPAVGLLEPGQKSQRVVGEFRQVPDHRRPRWRVDRISHTLHSGSVLKNTGLGPASSRPHQRARPSYRHQPSARPANS
jgi:hypothetical protein